MAWTIEYTATAEKQLRKLDKSVARKIVDYLDRRIAPLDDARSRGKGLTGSLGGFWRYRVGDFRVVCDVRDGSLMVLVVRVRHRRDAYRP